MMNKIEILQFMRDNPPPMAERTRRGYVAGIDAALKVLQESAAKEERVRIELVSYGDKKIQVIKAVRELTSLGLKEAKEFVESAPKELDHVYASATAAERHVRMLEEAGGTVRLRALTDA